MPVMSEETQYTAALQPTLTLDEAAHHSRIGNRVSGWVNDKTPGDSEIVLTDATLTYDLSEGEQVLIKTFYGALQTASDNCHFNVVTCTAIDGGGIATDVCGHFHVYSSGNLAGTENFRWTFDVPLRVRYQDGVRSISIKVNANDGAAIISCGWVGWVEDAED